VIPTVSWPLSYRFIGENRVLTNEFAALFTSCGFIQASNERDCITVIFVPARDLVTSEFLPEPIVEWRGLCIRKKADRILFSYRSWDLELDVTTLTFRCSGPDPAPGERIGFREFFLLSPLLFILHRVGYFELHAAGCAYQEFGYLFLGRSGSGKTTAMLSLIAAGWNYLSDDAMVISASPQGRIVARPLRRSFSLKPDHLNRYPGLDAYATELVPTTNKRRLDPRQVWPEQYTPVANPVFIVACTPADKEPTHITPIPRTESLARLVGSTPWLMFDQATASAHLETFRSLAATCRSFELKAGPELIQDGDRLASLIAPEALCETWLSFNKDERWA
jgi:hypothetical protein